MGQQDRTATTTEVDLLDLVAQTMEAALEDGEHRAELGAQVGIDALATADFHRTSRPGVVTVQFANGETWELTTTARVKCPAALVALHPLSASAARVAGRALSEETENAYNFGLYYSKREWTRIAVRLFVLGYSHDQAEQVIRSKEMRWAGDAMRTDKAPQMTLEKWTEFYERPNTRARIWEMLRDLGLLS